MGKDEKILLFSGILTWAVVFIIDGFIVSPLQPVSLSVYVIFVLLFLTPLITRSVPFWSSALMIEAIMALLIVIQDDIHIAPVLLVIWAAQLPEVFRRHTWWLPLTGANIFIVAFEYSQGRLDATFISVLAYAGFQIFAAFSSVARMNARESKQALERTNLKLVAAQAMLQQRSRLDERFRISRDLHDSIGHQLTALSLKLEHAKHDPPKDTADFIFQTHQSVNQILQDLREIVRKNRNENTISLTEILNRFKTAMRGQIRLDFPANLTVENAELAEQLVYCIQEGISNALRHGHADVIELSKSSDKPLVLELRDNGKGIGNFRPGNGINGMMERMQSFGGRVSLAGNGEKPGSTLCIRLENGDI